MVELAYTRDLKSLARIGLMGSSPIGATISLSPAAALGKRRVVHAVTDMVTQEVRSLRLDGFTGEQRSRYVCRGCHGESVLGRLSGP